MFTQFVGVCHTSRIAQEKNMCIDINSKVRKLAPLQIAVKYITSVLFNRWLDKFGKDRIVKKNILYLNKWQRKGAFSFEPIRWSEKSWLKILFAVLL